VLIETVKTELCLHYVQNNSNVPHLTQVIQFIFITKINNLVLFSDIIGTYMGVVQDM